MSMLLYALFLVLCFAHVAGNSIDVIDCSTSVENEVDRAKITFTSTAGILLYATNSNCYKCSKTLVGGSDACVSMFTPHRWTLYLQTADGTEIASKEYTFGELGEYTVSGVDSIDVKRTKEPVNSLRPLWILVGVLLALIVLSFGVPPLYAWILDRYFPAAPLEVSYTTVPLVESQESSDKTSFDAVKQEDKPKKPARLSSLDTFRGFSLCCMIFVNYGGGGYWFFEHAAWNGLTFADLLFPWFMWMMGVSMALSFASQLPKVRRASSEEPYKGIDRGTWLHVCKRSATLFLLGFFLNNGWDYDTWRVPGVLQYFAVSYFVTSCTVLGAYQFTYLRLQAMASQEPKYHHNFALAGYLDLKAYPRILSAYSYEWVIQAAVLLVYLSVALGGQAPGCPRGYNGPGGISEDGKYTSCTGGIHREVDKVLFGVAHFYQWPTCQEMYQCVSYDPEGFLGSLSACTLTYLGLMTGRIILHFKTHTERLTRFAAWAFVLLLLAGCLCGFSANGGVIPVNKNLWSTSFVLVAAGGGLVGLGLCYVFVDLLKVWSGAPFLYLGMNSILIYCAHEVFQPYMPFSYKLNHVSHGTLLQCDVIGVASWMVVAWYFYRIKFFVKV